MKLSQGSMLGNAQEQVKLLERLLVEQQRTNMLLEQLIEQRSMVDR